ncbi:hypothetical protein ACFE04_004952 [Oxalis oulophora]
MSAAAVPTQNEDKNKDPLHIELMVKDQGGQELHFRMRRCTKLHKLMDCYCARHSLGINSFHFYSAATARRLCPDQTPDQLQMEDGVELYASLRLGKIIMHGSPKKKTTRDPYKLAETSRMINKKRHVKAGPFVNSPRKLPAMISELSASGLPTINEMALESDNGYLLDQSFERLQI